MPALTASTIIGNSFKSMYDLLTNVTNGLTDPKNRGLARTKWIFPEFPDEYGSDFPGYPIVTIKVESSGKTSILGRQGRDFEINFMITVFADRNSDVDALSDEILDEINLRQSTLENYNLYTPELLSTSSGTEFRDPKKKVHIKSLFVRYMARSI